MLFLYYCWVTGSKQPIQCVFHLLGQALLTCPFTNCSIYQQATETYVDCHIESRAATSIKCQKIVKNVHLSFSKSVLMSLNVCHAITKDTQFYMIIN